jgi:hypothetical protein
MDDLPVAVAMRSKTSPGFTTLVFGSGSSSLAMYPVPVPALRAQPGMRGTNSSAKNGT